VSNSVYSRRQAAVRSVKLHVQFVIGNKRANRFEGPHREEHAISRDERSSAPRRHTCSGSHSIQLGDSHVEITVRVDVAEKIGLTGLAKVAFKHNKMRVNGPQLKQSLTKCAPRCTFSLGKSHTRAPFTSAIARAYCSSFGGFACRSVVFSMKLTPLPLVVLAMMQTGPSRYS
jgi:hypothetical protein